MANFNSIYVEIDIPYCSLDWSGTNEFGTCTAAGKPCYNTRNLSYDCQDKPNYTASFLTVRFYEDTGVEFIGDGQLSEAPTFPLIKMNGVKSSGAVIDPAESIGQRATCSITFLNTRATMSGLDKNVFARDRDIYNVGTFWGKFKARNSFIEGSEVRVYRGYSGRKHTVEHYVIEGTDGPDDKGIVRIKCVDFLKLTDGKKSLFPKPSSGRPVADISDTDLTFTLTPAGVGNAEYPASGYIAIGNEAMPFTRIDDDITMASRAFLGELSEHKKEDSVQVVGEFSGETVDYIINELITVYTPLDSSYVPIAAWASEISDYINNVYSAFIVKPEPVQKLLNELVQQAGLIFYADVESKQIILKALRPLLFGKEYSRYDSTVSGQTEMEGLRVSQVAVFYNQRTPFKKIDDESNYYSIVYDQTDENLYPSESIRRVFSRWIPSFGQSVAQTLSQRLIERYKNPPKEFDLSVHRNEELKTGDAIGIADFVEDDEGEFTSIKCFLTSVNKSSAKLTCKAQQFNFSSYEGQGGGANLTIDISTERYAVGRSLYDIYRDQYSNTIGVVSITFKVRPNVVVGSLSVGDFGGITPLLLIEPEAEMVGFGGSAIFQSYNEPTEGDRRNGGTAFVADYPVDIENLGIIGGGGGAGGNGGVIKSDGKYTTNFAQYGGAGAGLARGLGGGFYGLRQTQEIIEAGVNDSVLGDNLLGQDPALYLPENYQTSAGVGGNIGSNGAPGYEPVPYDSGNVVKLNFRDTYGGIAGKAIEGNSNINWVATGTIIGVIE
jgi:hypothetical protein